MSTFGGALETAPGKGPRRWLVWGLAFLGVVILGVAAQQIYVRTAAVPSAEKDPATLSPRLRATIGELKSFIEKERGLKFKKDVKVTLLSEDAFRKRISEGSGELDEKEKNDMAVTQDIFVALGLIGREVNLNDVANTAAEQGILGYYDLETDELVIRGNRMSPFLKTVLVHELTHALQDQHFDIARPELYDTDDDSVVGLAAVVEGDAGRIEQAYYESLTAEEERLVELEADDAGDPISSDIPQSLLSMVSFPYVVGPVFLDALFQAGGTEKINEALKNPPVTTEQLIYPELYLRGESSKPVAKPPAEGEIFDDGMFSQLGLIVILNETMDPEAAFEAADGWGGDQYVAWHSAGKSCVRFDMVMDTPRDQRELNTALRTWAKHHGGATVATVGGATRLTSCA